MTQALRAVWEKTANRLWPALAAFWMTVIFVKSGQSYTEQDMRPWLATWISERSLTSMLPRIAFTYDGQPVTWERPYDMAEFFVRKMGHVTEFAILSWLWAKALLRWRGTWARSWPPAAAVAILYAISDEWHQTFVPGRTGHAIDICVDAIGALLAIAVQSLYNALKKRRSDRQH